MNPRLKCKGNGWYFQIALLEIKSNYLQIRAFLHRMTNKMQHDTDGKTLKQPKISVVVPIYFEELVLQEFHRRTYQVLTSLQPTYDFEIIYVNDGSTDKSLPILLELHQKDPLHIKIVDFSRNFGHQLAVTAGIDHSSGDGVVVIDGDLQDPPEVIPKMIEKWQEGFHVIYGVREKREGETLFKLITAKVFYRVLSHFSDVPLPLDAGDFRFIDRKVVQALAQVRESNRYIRGLIAWLGFKQFGLLYHRDERFAGETKYTLKKMIKFAADGLTSFSDKPLLLAGYCGFTISFVGFIWALWIIGNVAFLGSQDLAKGWSSLAVMMLLFGGMQMIFLGIIGMYIGRIYKEVRGRPLYVVSKSYGL